METKLPIPFNRSLLEKAALIPPLAGPPAMALAERFSNTSFQGRRAHRIGPTAVAAREKGGPRRISAVPARRPHLEPFDERDVAFVREVVTGAGLDLAHYRLAPLLRRIPACLRRLKVNSIAEATTVLAARPDLAFAALDSLLIGTTEFFRDAPVFEELQRVVPELAAPGKPPRVWSVACSDGVELYSVAMILARAGFLAGAHLLGTDCRPMAIERARRGVYPAACLERIPAAYQDAFIPQKDGVRIRDELRGATRWDVADALLPPAGDGWDLILCRNFTIYLGAGATQRLWTTLAGVLNPGGLLVVGKAEKPHLPGLARECQSVYRKTPLIPGSR